MWLADFFPEEDPFDSPVSNCRTMIYGYNTQLGSQGVHTIKEFAVTFLDELMKARSTEPVRFSHPGSN